MLMIFQLFVTGAKRKVDILAILQLLYIFSNIQNLTEWLQDIKTSVHVQQIWDIVTPQHWPDRESDSQTVSCLKLSNTGSGSSGHTLSNTWPFCCNHFSTQSWWGRKSVFIHSSHQTFLNFDRGALLWFVCDKSEPFGVTKTDTTERLWRHHTEKGHITPDYLEYLH